MVFQKIKFHKQELRFLIIQKYQFIIKVFVIKTIHTKYYVVNTICLLLVALLYNENTISNENVEGDIDAVSLILPLKSERTDKDNITKFDGELFRYDIGFWIFKKMGTAILKCEVEHGNVTVTIDAYTTGLIDKIIHRHNNYRVTMVLDNGTKRLKPLLSYEKKIKGEKERVKITEFDYVNEVRKFKILKNGVLHSENEAILNGNVRDDAMSAFYNLRNGIYGEVKEGAKFDICTTYRDRTTDSKVYVRLPESTDKLTRWNGVGLKAGFVADITMDPEIFDSEEGKLLILLTDDLRPIGFIAKDVMGFGDLYGVLVRETN